MTMKYGGIIANEYDAKKEAGEIVGDAKKTFQNTLSDMAMKGGLDNTLVNIISTVLNLATALTQNKVIEAISNNALINDRVADELAKQAELDRLQDEMLANAPYLDVPEELEDEVPEDLRWNEELEGPKPKEEIGKSGQPAVDNDQAENEEGQRKTGNEQETRNKKQETTKDGQTAEKTPTTDEKPPAGSAAGPETKSTADESVTDETGDDQETISDNKPIATGASPTPLEGGGGGVGKKPPTKITPPVSEQPLAEPDKEPKIKPVQPQAGATTEGGVQPGQPNDAQPQQEPDSDNTSSAPTGDVPTDPSAPIVGKPATEDGQEQPDDSTIAGEQGQPGQPTDGQPGEGENQGDQETEEQEQQRSGAMQMINSLRFRKPLKQIQNYLEMYQKLIDETDKKIKELEKALKPLKEKKQDKVRKKRSWQIAKFILNFIVLLLNITIIFSLIIPVSPFVSAAVQVIKGRIALLKTEIEEIKNEIKPIEDEIKKNETYKKTLLKKIMDMEKARRRIINQSLLTREAQGAPQDDGVQQG